MATAKKGAEAPAKDTEAAAGTALELADPTTGELMVVDDFSEYEEDAAKQDKLTSDDVAIPFIEVLQSNSPECQGEDGARPGQIVNRTTGRVYSGKEGIIFLPVKRVHLMVEWKPRELGGGVVAQHDMASDLARHVQSTQPLGKYKHPEGLAAAKSEEDIKKVNDLIETFYMYGIVLPDGDDEAPYPAVIAFSSTKIKPYKSWAFQLDGLMGTNPNTGRKFKWPWHAHMYRLTTETINRNNYTWSNWVIRFAEGDATKSRIPSQSLPYQMARVLLDQLIAGEASADVSSLKRDENDADAPPPKGDTGSEKAPY